MLVQKKKTRNRSYFVRGHAYGGLLVVSAAALGITQFAIADPQTPDPVPVEIDVNIGIEAQVRDFFTANDAEEMIPIIACESGFRHHNTDGSILKNKEGSSAIGVAQILASKHPDPKVIRQFNRRHNTELSVEDFDIETLSGNLAYALLLYKVRGTRDWECAR